MNLISAIAIYFIIWWVTLFAVLPWGVVTHSDVSDEAPDDLVEGTPASAPLRPMILRKMIITTGVAAVIFACVYTLFAGGFMTLDDVPFLPRFDFEAGTEPGL